MRLEEKLGEGLKKTGFTISVAESCTGGLLASRITDVPGSSAYFRGGIVAYQDDVKERLLGVPAQVLAEKGAVSEETARAMAYGVRKLLQSDVGVSITGIAGPAGGSTDKPVGLAYIAVESPAGRRCKRFLWSGDRASNREDSVRAALEMALSLLEEA